MLQTTIPMHDHPDIESIVIEAENDEALGNSKFVVRYRPNALPPKSRIDALGANQSLDFQVGVRLDPDLAVTVGIGKVSEPVSSRTGWKLPADIDTALPHALRVQFADWQVASVQFDDIEVDDMPRPEHATRKYTLVPHTAQIVEAPPDETIKHTGTVIVKWSYIEHIVRTSLFSALQLREDLCRAVVRDPRPSDFMNMIQDVLQIKGVRVDFAFGRFGNRLDAARARRDAVAHGVFAKDPITGALSVLDAQGKWDMGSHSESLKKRIRPTLQPVDAEFWRLLEDELDALTKECQQLHDMIVTALKA